MWYFFPPLLQKAEILVVLVKKSLFVQKKRRCNVAVWSGNVAVAKSLIIWKISKNAVPHKKKVVLSEKLFFEQKAEILHHFEDAGI
jgi:hypothetical protein